jgi:endonuclease/exonuclease/phosphatase family metal-dependent hydrolase
VGTPTGTCRGLGSGVEWRSLAPAEDQPALDRWCDSVGPPLLVDGAPETPVASLVVVSWNVHVGRGEVDRLIAWLDDAPHIKRPYALVLLLQEAVRGGPAVPATVPQGMEPPGAIRTRSDTQDIAAVVARLSLHAAYVPSMRNGALFAPDTQQDRGNAILSTHALTAVRAIELPFGKQRRVVAAATVSVPGLPPIDVAAVHLDSSGHRAVEARALAPLLEEWARESPLVVGADLNTWFGRREEAFKTVAAALPEAECGRGKTNTWPRRLHWPLGWWRGRLDYLFDNLDAREITRTCETIDERFGSDHNPIVMTIDIPPAVAHSSAAQPRVARGVLSLGRMRTSMAWDWIEKGTKRLGELGGEYKHHRQRLERLLLLDPEAARRELLSAWSTMDERSRAGMKMTLAGLALTQQAATSSASAQTRGERLKALQAVLADAERATPAPGRSASSEAAFTAGAARVTERLAGMAERARPKAEEVIESARRGIERHGPAVEAAVKNVVSELLKTAKGAQPRPASPPPAEAAAGPASQPAEPPPDARVRPAATTYAGTPAIAGHWVGTLRGAGTDTLGCDLHIAASGRPIWSYTDTDGFHQQELTHAGQQLLYVPPERGVVTVIVHSVTGSSTETGYVVDYAFERSSNGYLTQRYQRIFMAGRLSGAQLEVMYSEQGLSSFGDRTGLAANSDGAEYRGSLTKQA